MNRSLSIAVHDGRNLISISEYKAINGSLLYIMLVTNPEVENAHVSTVIDKENIVALINILQEIIKEDKE